MTLSAQLRELGQLARNLQDAEAQGNVALAQAEMSDWVRAATRLLGELAIEVHSPDRTKTAPEGVVVDEMVEEMCTFEDADCNRCVLGAEHVGPCRFDVAKAVRR